MSDASLTVRLGELLLVGTGGFLGSSLRYLVSGWVQRLAGAGFPLDELIPTQSYGVFIVTANLLLIPVGLHLAKKSIARMTTLAVLLATATFAFFTMPLG